VEVKPTQPELTALKITARDLPEAIKNWKVGESLLAVARRDSESGKVTLQIANLTVQAQTDKPVKAGQTFQLLIETLGRRPVLRVVENSPPPDPKSVALRNLIPLQRPLTELLASLTQLSQTKLISQILATTTTAQGATQKLPLATDLPSTLTASRAATLTTSTSPIGPTTGGTLTNALNNPAISRNALRSIIETAQKVFQNIPEARNISKPGGMQQAIKDSGHFFEAKMFKALQSGTRPDITTDFKAGLSQLLSLLKSASSGQELPNTLQRLVPSLELPLPGAMPQAQLRSAPALPLQDALRLLADLIRQTEGSLARIQLHQLSSVPNSEGESRPPWLLELPLRNGQQIDLLQLKIEEEDAEQKREVEERTWSIKLAFALDTLGPLHIRVTYRKGTISSTIWAEQSAAAELFKNSMPLLEEQLKRAGLTIGKLDTHLGTPPYRSAAGAETKIVDEQA